MAFGYHTNTGNIADPIVSHSAMCTIDPEMGGHPLDFLAFIQRTEEDIQYTPSLERGDLLHAWLEDESAFVIADLTKPAPQVALMAEKFFDLYINKQYEITSGFQEFAEQRLSIEFNDILELNKIYKELIGETGSDDDIQLLIRCILFSRKLAEVDKRLTDTKIIEKFKEAVPYIKFLKSASGKYIMDLTTRNIITNCYASIKRHPFANQFLGNDYHNEKEVYWEETWNDVIIKRKAKIDRYKVIASINDGKTRKLTIKVADFKTTAKPVSNFKEGSYKYYKYGRQLVNYLVAICKDNNVRIEDISFELYNIVVQTTGNYPTIVYKSDSLETFTTNMKDYEQTMNRIAYHIKNNVWEVTMEEHQQGYVSI
jgi:hypothetical protein